MNANAFIKVDKATFYRFVERHPEGRYEYVRGRIMQQMTGGTRRHMRIAGRLKAIMERQLDAEKWIALEGRGVETVKTIRYPDVVVEPASEPDQSLSTTLPAIVVEVLSEWSEDRDLDVKPGEYKSIRSLHAYIIASQDEPACFVYLRGHNGQFPIEPTIVRGLDKTIDIPALSLVIPLTEIYRGLIAPPATGHPDADKQS